MLFAFLLGVLTGIICSYAYHKLSRVTKVFRRASDEEDEGNDLAISRRSRIQEQLRRRPD